MSLRQRLSNLWREDPLLGSVVRNTGYLFSSNTISMGLTFLQGLLAAALLGARDYGILGMVIAFASNVNRLLSFRMNELVVRYGGAFLAEDRKPEAAAVVKVAGLSEAGTSVLAYGVLLLLARWGANVIIKDPSIVPWIGIYGLALLANLATETSQAVLQLGRHFRTQAVLTLAQNVITAGWILAAFILRGDLIDVLLAYLAGKCIYGLGMLVAALVHAGSLMGKDWWKQPLKLGNGREMFKFAISTNLSQTVNLFVRDSEVLWVGYFLTSVEAGYYKFALAIMNVILMPITPFIQTTFPEIMHSVAQKAWQQVRNLLRRTSRIALAWTGTAALGILVFGNWLLGIFKGGEYLPALPVVWLLLIGYGFANIFYWNRLVLLAFGRPNFPLVVTAVAGAVKIGLMFLLVPRFGMMIQAGLLSAYFVASIGLITFAGVKALKKGEQASLKMSVAS